MLADKKNQTQNDPLTWFEQPSKQQIRFYFIKSLFQSNIVFFQRHGNVKVEVRPPSSSFNFWRLYRAEVKNGRG